MLTTSDVRIASPCGVDWTKMTRREASRRYCAECRKHVHDLSSMTRAEANDLLASAQTDGLCVRYFANEHGELLFRPDVPVSRLKRALLAVAAVVAPLSLTACPGTSEAPPPMMGAVAPYAPLPTTSASAPSPTEAPSAPPSDLPGTTKIVTPSK